MAYIVDSSHNDEGETNSFVVPLLSHQTDDLLVILVGHDTNGGAPQDTTGWTKIESINNTGSGSDLMMYYRVATSSSETDPTITHSDTDSMGWVQFVIRDADTSDPINGSGSSEINGTATQPVQSAALTTDEDNCLIIRAFTGDQSGRWLADPGYQTFVEPDGDTGPNVIVSVQETAGAVDRPYIYPHGNTEGQQLTVAINNATGGGIEPYVTTIGEVIDPCFNTNYPTGLTLEGISLLISSVDGKTTSIDSPSLFASGLFNKNGWEGIGGGSDFNCAEFDFPSTKDFTDNIFVACWAVRAAQNITNVNTIAERAVAVGLHDGTNWTVYQVWAKDQKDPTAGFQGFAVDPSQMTTALDNSGTLDETSIDHFMLMQNGGTSQAPWCHIAMMPRCPVIVGGGAGKPITGQIIRDTYYLSGFLTVVQQGESQFLWKHGMQFGNGSSETYLDVNNEAWEVGRSYDEDERRLSVHYADNTVEFIYYGVSGDTIRHRNSSLAAPTPFKWTIDASSTSAATWDFGGLKIEGAGTVTLQDVTTFEAMTFLACGEILDNGAEVTGCRFTVTDAVGADDGLVSWDSSTDISDSDFVATDLTDGHAIIIETPGTYTFTGLTFTGFGADGTDTAAVYNDSGGAVTINIAGGGNTPTVRNGASASTTVQSSVSVTVTAITATGTPIQNARVFLETSPGGVDIFDGSDGTSLTDSNGEVTTSYSGTTPVSVTGRVRKSSSSPFYKTGIISGQITSSGFSSTIVMVLDE